jgi:hypothetical protein
LAAVLVAAAIAATGCGGDDEEASTTPTETTTTPTATVETPTETEPPEPETETEAEPETTPAESPEEEDGGAGDEVPARTLALFTARDGRITPRVIRVPAFISIQVELRSADGRTYTLDFGRLRLVAGGQLNSVSSDLPGLRPGEALVGRPRGDGNRVRIEATAEPGP